MTFIIVENLRGFFNSRPPLVVFMICLASFAIALITFAYIVKTKDMPNPDISEDWNTFLSRVSHLSFCVPHNASMGNTTSVKLQVADQSPAEVYNSIKDKMQNDQNSHFASPSSRHIVRRSVSGGQVPTREQGKKKIFSELEEMTTTVATMSADIDSNVTLFLNVQIKPTSEFLSQPLSSLHFTAGIPRSMLKIKGAEKEDKLIITMNFLSNLSQSLCKEWNGQECTLYELSSCVTFSGPASILPQTQKPHNADMCMNWFDMTSDSLQKNMSAATLMMSSSNLWCQQGVRLSMDYSFDESLTVMLSEQDRSMINLHLMRTSYFLFVMVITLFCYAMVRGRPTKIKTVHVVYDKVSSQP
ncbi:transmembrane protein 248 [Biomphalaria glabrata]|uniref:Transmembrane protein 248-like n=1 Tax=Biomphalaria glabrata TaxID=6526 RepID=A0A2C9LU51_BIOGL|nr:transmembrane protein 248-like [Biomphalaria glabrata]XP_013068208.1 transmembrane protein 248-like [Biomphalaria glabrata]XP_055861547.1 transmembrane protein 248-like [Biomphalaria glabrata]XP_055861548.1 transmembrane protein 248-like [Biomphalaria glabrata]KAI8753386.1 transmembrane protein 248-like [Biomphalaria glabrata]KAI8783198.1 transmembrane protein 248 [Biomphalaria glabrata]